MCGLANEFLLIADNGDGSCTAVSFSGGKSAVVSCLKLVYGTVCNTLLSSVVVIIQRTRSVPYVPPNIEQWLRNMGLAGVGVLAQSLSIQIDHTPNPIPPSIAPVFFANLSQVCHVPGQISGGQRMWILSASPLE